MKTWKEEVRNTYSDPLTDAEFREMIISLKDSLNELGKATFLGHTIEYGIDEKGSSTGYIIIDGADQYRSWEKDCIKRILQDILFEELETIFEA